MAQAANRLTQVQRHRAELVGDDGPVNAGEHILHFAVVRAERPLDMNASPQQGGLAEEEEGRQQYAQEPDRQANHLIRKDVRLR